MRVRHLGLRDYLPVWEEMQQFTAERDARTPDELWVVEHLPVFTLGLNGKSEHLLDPGDIQVIRVDRGGQVTYHGPGQVVIYILLDLHRLHLNVRGLVTCSERAVIQFLADQGIPSEPRREAPGVYVRGRKIAALGLRIRRGCSYHGLAFNVDMDLSAFKRINPCGYRNLEVCQLRDLDIHMPCCEVAVRLCEYLKGELGVHGENFANRWSNARQRDLAVQAIR